MSEYIYEVVDATDDCQYFPLGVFDDFDFCRQLIMLACPEQPISDNAEEYEVIEVRKRRLNDWNDGSDVVFQVKRTQTYFDDLDEYLWKTEVTKETTNE